MTKLELILTHDIASPKKGASAHGYKWEVNGESFRQKFIVVGHYTNRTDPEPKKLTLVSMQREYHKEIWQEYKKTISAQNIEIRGGGMLYFYTDGKISEIEVSDSSGDYGLPSKKDVHAIIQKYHPKSGLFIAGNYNDSPRDSVWIND